MFGARLGTLRFLTRLAGVLMMFGCIHGKGAKRGAREGCLGPRSI